MSVTRHRNRERRGFALIMVLIVMAVLVALTTTNAVVLARLRGFLTDVERQQVEKFETAPAGGSAETRPK